MFKKSMLSLFVMVALVAGMNAANAVEPSDEASVNVNATVADYRDIKAGEELLINYSEFEDVEQTGWVDFGVGIGFTIIP